ncbi:MAG: hypothetical protein KDA41_02090, partial [Planctomycetales bacterium]|nr:hypothetical protein [Planctomycetales bacterium]
MFCSHCGAQADGNFCWSCGSRLKAGAPIPAQSTPEPIADCVVLAEIVSDDRRAPPPPPPADAVWHDEHRYQVLLHFPDV